MIIGILLLLCENNISLNNNNNDISYFKFNETVVLNFDEAFKQIAKYEGGYGNDPHDSGGETYCGISRRFHPNWHGWYIIDNNKPIRYNKTLDCLKEDVYNFYKERYWHKLIDQVYNQKLSEELFDVSVNMGSYRAIMFLKSSLKSMSYDIKVDGILDNITLRILEDNRNDTTFMDSLTVKVNELQKNRYYQIIRNNPSKVKYLKSWLRRC